MILKDFLDIIYDYSLVRIVDSKTLKLIASGKLAADIKNNCFDLLTLAVVHIGMETFDDKGTTRQRFVVYLNGDEYAEAKAKKKGKTK